MTSVATAAYEAKRALFDLLAAQTATGMPLDGVQVAYSCPTRDLQRRCIYGGWVRFNQDQAVAEWNVLRNERVEVSIFIRVLDVAAGSDIRTVDTDVEGVVTGVWSVLVANPKLAGNLTWIGLSSGISDYSQSPDGPEVVLALQAGIQAILS